MSVEPLASMCWLAWAWRRKDAARHRQRMSDLRESGIWLRRHFATLAAILDHPDAPPDLKQAAAEISRALEDHDAMSQVVGWLEAGEDVTHADQPVWLADMLQQVRASTPDLAAAFSHCIDTGFVAAVLRWPDTAATWRIVSARFVSTPDRELILARRLRPASGATFSAPSFA